jgi:hypothetical protein
MTTITPRTFSHNPYAVGLAQSATVSAQSATVSARATLSHVGFARYAAALPAQSTELHAQIEEIAKLRDQVAVLTEQNGEIAAAFAAQTMALNVKTEEAAELRDRVVVLTEQNGGVTGAFAAQKTELHAQIEEVAKLRDKLAVLTEQNGKIAAAFAAQKTALNAKTEEAAELRDRVAVLTQQNGEIAATFAAQKKQLNVNISELKTQIRALTCAKEEAIAALATQHNAKIAEFKTKISVLTQANAAEKTALATQRTRFEVTIGELRTKIGVLAQQLSVAATAVAPAARLLESVRQVNDQCILDLSVPVDLRLGEADLCTIFIEDRIEIEKTLTKQYWNRFLRYCERENDIVPENWSSAFILSVAKAANLASTRNNRYLNQIMIAFFANQKIVKPGRTEYTQLLLDHPLLTCILWQSVTSLDPRTGRKPALFKVWKNEYDSFVNIVISAVFEQDDGDCAAHWTTLTLFAQSVSSSNPEAMRRFLLSLRQKPEKQQRFEIDLLEHPALKVLWEAKSWETQQEASPATK